MIARNEETSRTFFDSSSDAMLIIEEGRFVDCNEAAVKILRHTSKEDFLNRHPAELSPEVQPDGNPSFDKAEEMFNIALAKGAHRFEWAHQKRDGEEFLVEVSLTAVSKDTGYQLHAVWRDISERKRTEEALRVSLQKLTRHMEQTPLAVVGWNLDFEVTEWNAAAENIFGYTRHEALGRHASFILPESARPHVDDLWRRLLLNNGGISSTNQNLTKDGQVILCEWYNMPLADEQGNVFGATSKVMDITERQQAEEEKGRLMLAIEQLNEMVLITDADGNLQYVNPAFEKVTGYSRKEVMGKNPRLLQSGKHPPEFYKQMWAALAAGNPWAGRLINRKKDGTIYTEEASISPVTDPEGSIINYVSAKWDVTHERELEEQLQQAQKMEAVGQMAGGIAHDFNNLLQIIAGYAELARVDLSPRNPVEAALQEINDAVDRGQKLVSQLLAFSRRQVICPVDLNLNEVIEPLFKMIRGLIGEHIQLDIIPGHNLGTVHADRGMLEQVLVNLCVNARDAMPDGGRLRIKTENVLADSAYAQRHSLAKAGRYILLSVDDTGCGIDEQTRERIFEPFFTTKEVGKGTGLGLSMVYGIIKQHNGQVRVYSEPGQGTTFNIHLPAVARRAAVVPGEAFRPALGGTETLLLAEDDDAVLHLAERTLRLAGYTVLTAKDGEEAVRVFEEHAEYIDMVMLDVVMPRTGGKEAAERILAKHPGLPYLFVSGYSESTGHTNFIQNRELHLLSKPYKVETLLCKIREVLGQGAAQPAGDAAKGADEI